MTTTVHSPLLPDQRLALIERARLSVLEARYSAPSPWLAAPIERSWRGCLAMGQDPHQRVAFEPVSAGSVRAVFYALGYSPDEIEDIFDTLDQTSCMVLLLMRDRPCLDWEA